MKFLSLFSGVGGFDLALERAGMQCVGQAERDKHCLKVLTHHWPDVPKIGDVRDVTRENTAAIDLICGGFPCQDVSVAGRRAGLAGERSGLWFEFLRILQALTPQWVVIENVPGLLHSNAGRDFATILYGLGECGYRTSWRVLDAQYFGVAQRRRRVFLIASLNSGRSAQVLFERESGGGSTQPRQTSGQELADIAGTLTSSASGVSRTGQGETDKLVPITRVYGQQAFGAYQDDSAVASTLKSCDGKDATDLIAIAFPWQNSIANSMTPLNDISPVVKANTVNAVAYRVTGNTNAEPRNVYVTKPDTAGTLRTKGGDGELMMVNQFGVRRLTPRECERLQGFPDDWTAVDGMPDSQRYKQMGNAIAVPVGAWIARRIMENV